MKKMLIAGVLLLSSLSISFGTFAQDRAVVKGNMLIDGYYGAPNFGKYFAKNLTSDNENLTLGKVTGVGPAGVRVEYMLADKFGLGADLIFNSFAIDAEYDSLNSDGTLYKTYTGTLKMQRIRAHLRFNYHFVSTQKLDSYFGVGAGYNGRSYTLEADDSDFNKSMLDFGRALIPVSMRLAVGMRYYFIPNLGLNAEIGIGGPLISAGVSLKF